MSAQSEQICLLGCPYAEVQYKPAFCARCRPEEFGDAVYRFEPIAQAWASNLHLEPFERLELCGHCGEQRARKDGFCGRCGQGSGASGYISYQITAADELSNPTRWTRRRQVAKTDEKPPSAQVAHPVLLAGPVIEKPKKRRSRGVR